MKYQSLSNQIAILLPQKEGFSKNNFGSVSLYVKDINKKSKFKKNIIVCAHCPNDPFKGFKIRHLSKSYNHLFFGKNFGHTKKFINNFDKKDPPKIIEIHNRPRSVFQISVSFPESKIFLFYHNDPFSFKESATVESRLELIEKCHFICFVSEYLKKRFLKGLPKSKKINHKLQVIYNGVEPIQNKNRKTKKQNIVFIGELTENKGFDIFLDTVHDFCNSYNNWKVDIYGKAKNSKYLIKKNPNIFYHGFLPHDIIMKKLEKSSICVVPSVWNEPFGRTLLESVNAGVATITSLNGGLKEIASYFRVIKLKIIDKKTIYNALKKLIMSKNEIEFYSKNKVSNTPFTLTKISYNLDSLRKGIVG